MKLVLILLNSFLMVTVVMGQQKTTSNSPKTGVISLLSDLESNLRIWIHESDNESKMAQAKEFFKTYEARTKEVQTILSIEIYRQNREAVRKILEDFQYGKNSKEITIDALLKRECNDNIFIEISILIEDIYNKSMESIVRVLDSREKYHDLTIVLLAESHFEYTFLPAKEKVLKLLDKL